MRRKERMLIVLAGTVVAAVLVVVLWPRGKEPHEPEYQGKKLSEWIVIAGRNLSHEELDALGRTRSFDGLGSPAVQEAVQAVRHIGTNGLPFLLKRLSYERPVWRGKLLGFRSLPDAVHDAIGGRGPQDVAGTGKMGLLMLGDGAIPAVPRLTRIMNEWKPGMGCVYAMETLSALGTNGLAPLTAALTNQQGPALLRFRVAEEIGGMGSKGLPGIPALVTAANDPDPLVRLNAVRSLGEFGTNALVAVPVLIKAAEDSASYVRAEATNALLKVAPEVLTNGVSGK